MRRYGEEFSPLGKGDGDGLPQAQSALAMTEGL